MEPSALSNSELAIGFCGLGLTAFGLGFAMWSRRLKEVIEWARKIEHGQRELLKDFHEHELAVERRISVLEAKINGAR